MTNLKSLVKRLIDIVQNKAINTTFTPYLLPEVDKERLINDLSQFFNLTLKDIELKLHKYRAFHESKGYAGQFGERKTLSFEEAFIIYMVLEITRPSSIIEIGTDYGKSTRRIIDIKNVLGIKSQVICFDIFDHVKYFTQDEAKLILKDITNTFCQDVLDAYEPGVIFLDAHPYYLLKNVIYGVLNYPRDWTIAIHDCSPGLCNPKMKLSKEDLNIKSTTGVWERHVLADAFNVNNPLSKRLDNLKTPTHHLRIFETTHGLAVIMPKGNPK